MSYPVMPERASACVKLGALGTGLVSRSEARRLLKRVTEFTHVTLDFSGVDVVGQGFCDEISGYSPEAIPRPL